MAESRCREMNRPPAWVPVAKILTAVSYLEVRVSKVLEAVSHSSRARERRRQASQRGQSGIRNISRNLQAPAQSAISHFFTSTSHAGNGTSVLGLCSLTKLRLKKILVLFNCYSLFKKIKMTKAGGRILEDPYRGVV